MRYLRRLLRRFLVAFGAAALLWFGLGEPGRHPATHRAEWVAVDGLRLRVLDAGRGDTTLLFLHGYGESLLSWRLVVDHFTRHYHVIALDLPGFGLSDKPDTSYSQADYARWLGDFLLTRTTGPVVVIGHSMGGQIAASLALEHPDRVVAAVLISTAGNGINTILTDTGGIASPSMLWVASAIGYVLPVHDTAWLREPAGGEDYQPGGDSALTRASRRVLEQFDFSALKGDFPGLRQPVLLIWGRQDPTIPLSIGVEIAAALPCRRFVPLTALHRPHQTAPDTVVSEIAAFLHHPVCGER